ncbi:hypothetical protein FJR77_07200 [Streptococcus shenyangsis]|uniref:Uncharacterized protein n=1 Tax=Streptococcus shenyangsis TaxID=2589786 RepID=A0ABY2YI77_9STRE|nr:hypothetical protein FJR73_07265 [Streptococcus sp. D2]TPE39213.1 hypothetical protein FJR77_07200 [Streptococcus shenyangsis]
MSKSLQNHKKRIISGITVLDTMRLIVGKCASFSPRIEFSLILVKFRFFLLRYQSQSLLIHQEFQPFLAIAP